nr:hypothetical protein [uncultured Brevundimonas sp.]
MARKPRKARIDSATEAVAVMLKAAKEIEAPAHAPLESDALPFWDDIIAARAKSEWNGHDLAIASDLANAMAMLVEQRRLLRSEGVTTTGPKGGLTTHPRVSVVHGLHAQIKAARQSLNIHGRAAGEARDVAKRRAQAKEIEDGNPLADEDLLARPTALQ